MPSEVVLVIDASCVAGELIAATLAQSFPDIQIYSSAEMFLHKLKVNETGCLVTGQELSGISGLELMRQLSRRDSSFSTIIVTEGGTFQSAVEAFRSGAFDLIEEPIQSCYLVERIKEGLVRSSVTQARKEAFKLSTMKWKSLSVREQQVITLIVKGGSNKLVAFELGISEKTVETHRSRSMNKMGAGNPLALAKMLNLLDL